MFDASAFSRFFANRAWLLPLGNSSRLHSLCAIADRSASVQARWRQNPRHRASISRLFCLRLQCPCENSSAAYPRLEIASLTKDSYVLFEGVIDTFNASTQIFNVSLTTKFTFWQKPYPTRTYNQNEFTSIVDSMNDSIFWGRQKTT